MKSQDQILVSVYIKPWNDGSLNVCHVCTLLWELKHYYILAKSDVSINFWLNKHFDPNEQNFEWNSNKIKGFAS